MSYVLNHSGVPIPASGYHVSSGGDGRWYMVRVNEMMPFLARTFGTPDLAVKTPHPAAFAGMRGLMVVQGTGWSNASSHVTLSNGATCSDHCHLTADPDNGTFTPLTAALWVLS